MTTVAERSYLKARGWKSCFHLNIFSISTTAFRESQNQWWHKRKFQNDVFKSKMLVIPTRNNASSDLISLRKNLNCSKHQHYLKCNFCDGSAYGGRIVNSSGSKGGNCREECRSSEGINRTNNNRTKENDNLMIPVEVILSETDDRVEINFVLGRGMKS